MNLSRSAVSHCSLVPVEKFSQAVFIGASVMFILRFETRPSFEFACHNAFNFKRTVVKL